jgi:hypothetical protein
MRLSLWKLSTLLAVPAVTVLAGIGLAQPQQEDFEVVRKRMQDAKPAIQKKHADLTARRHDLAKAGGT